MTAGAGDPGASGPPRPTIPLPAGLTDGHLVYRRDRFTLEVLVAGRPALAHLHDPGRLPDLVAPGRRLRLAPAPAGGGRRTAWTAILARDGRGWAPIHSLLANRLVGHCLAHRLLPALADLDLVGREVAAGDGRFDFRLRDRAGRPVWLEVKSATLLRSGVAVFPDAPTRRGTRHVNGLAELARQGQGAVICFVAGRAGATAVAPNPGVDPAFADALATARQAGVRVMAVAARVRNGGLSLGPALPVLGPGSAP